MSVTEDKILYNKLKKLKDKANTSHITHLSNFLTEREQGIYNSVFKNDPCFQLFGGYENAENKRALYDPNYEYNFKISTLVIKKSKEDNIQHRHVLGTILSTGISRESVGDIVIEDEMIYIFTRKTIAKHLIDEVKSINRVYVELKEVDNVNLVRKDNYLEKKIFIDNMRLDNLLSKVYNMSRNISKELIKKGDVKLNHADIEKTTKQCSLNDIISVKRYGRFKILNQEGTSKSGKNILNIGIYR